MTKLKEVQQKEVELLKIFDDICRVHNLTYYALGGTLLGAIRHGGFIPWDDDMDLGMPRKDYERFIELSSTILPEYVKLIIHYDNLNNTSIRDISTTIIFGEKECHPFIDIFPLDGYPKEGLEAKFHKYHILFYRMLSKVSVVDDLIARDRGKLENLIVTVSKKIKIGKLINTRKVNTKLQKKASKQTNKQKQKQKQNPSKLLVVKFWGSQKFYADL